jgi:hypothetical protein
MGPSLLLLLADAAASVPKVVVSADRELVTNS